MYLCNYTTVHRSESTDAECLTTSNRSVELLTPVNGLRAGAKTTEVNKTTEASVDVLESIENLTVAAMPAPVSYDPNDHIGKCSVRS